MRGPGAVRTRASLATRVWDAPPQTYAKQPGLFLLACGPNLALARRAVELQQPLHERLQLLGTVRAFDNAPTERFIKGVGGWEFR